MEQRTTVEDVQDAIENMDEALENLEKAGLIVWDRGAGIVQLTERGKEVGGLLPKEWEVQP